MVSSLGDSFMASPNIYFQVLIYTDPLTSTKIVTYVLKNAFSTFD